jgi:hypothetical protein
MIADVFMTDSLKTFDQFVWFGQTQRGFYA